MRFRTMSLVAGTLLALLVCGCHKQSAAGRVGRTGSLSRFAIDGEMLYALGPDRLSVLSLRDPTRPTLLGVQGLPPGAETLFLHDRRLFIGTRTGMWIYDVSRGEAPRRLGGHEHIYSCDPVVVQGDHAFVTLRSGPACRRGVNELRVYDVTDPRHPALQHTVPMASPGGLGADGPYLFVTNGPQGVDVFDIRQPLAPVLVARMEGLHGYDVIPNAGVLVVSAEDGIYQFDYRSWPIRQISRVPILSSRPASHHASRRGRWR